MNNLKVNDRFGVVWRQTPSSDGLGSAYLILNGTDEFEIASGISPSKIYIKLNGNVDEIRLVPESERSRLWCPHSTCLTNRISLYPVRHSYQAGFLDTRFRYNEVRREKAKFSGKLSPISVESLSKNFVFLSTHLFEVIESTVLLQIVL